MNSYQLEFATIGVVTVQKKRGMRSLRMRIASNGDVIISAPWHVPKAMVINFVKQRIDWIEHHRDSYRVPLRDGLKFGHHLQLRIIENQTSRHSSVANSILTIRLPNSIHVLDSSTRNYIETRMIKAMQAEAEEVLLPKLLQIARDTGHSFNQANVKRLSSRWGSCDQQKNIILNVFLTQLPDELQCYIMLHELTHTLHMNHSPQFWDHVQKFIPEMRRLRKELHVHKPRLEERI